MEKKEQSIIRVTLFGACGRMGSETASLLSKEPDYQLVNLVESREHPSQGNILFGLRLCSELSKEEMKGTVCCEFTNHLAALKNASLAVEAGCPILVGTTGFSAAELQLLKRLGEKIAVMLAPNLSRGVDLLYRLAEISARVLAEGFGVEIVEAHHRWKQDAPSGTAKKLAEIIKEQGGFREVPTHSLRMGDITGEHRIIFAGEGETVEIIHRATSRRAFACGVPPALKFLSSAPAGFYNFRDCLGV